MDACAVAEMTVLQDRAVTVPSAAWSVEYEATCTCYKCQRPVKLAMPTPRGKPLWPATSPAALL